MRRGVIAAAAVLAALAVSSPAVAQTEPGARAGTKAESKPATPQTAAARASALLRAGRIMEALAVLTPAVKARPNDLTLLFLVGRASIAAAGRKGLDDKTRTLLLDSAITALRRMLTIRPGLVRPRLELARAFFLKREDALARRHFERVLAGDPMALDCRELAIRIFEATDETRRRAAARAFVRKKCF